MSYRLQIILGQLVWCDMLPVTYLDTPLACWMAGLFLAFNIFGGKICFSYPCGSVCSPVICLWASLALTLDKSTTSTQNTPQMLSDAYLKLWEMGEIVNMNSSSLAALGWLQANINTAFGSAVPSAEQICCLLGAQVAFQLDISEAALQCLRSLCHHIIGCSFRSSLSQIIMLWL